MASQENQTSNYSDLPYKAKRIHMGMEICKTKTELV